jgi:3-hydroxyisobutyrate dehydrogenase
VLRDLSTRLLRLGERIGDGARTKLVNNLLAGVNLAAAAEALALAERLGLDARRTLQVFEQSSAQSWIGSDRLPRALDGDFEPCAHTRLLAKDTTLAMAMAGDAGLQPLLGATAQQLFARACAQGLAAQDDEPADSDAAMVRRRSQVNCARRRLIRVSVSWPVHLRPTETAT